MGASNVHRLNADRRRRSELRQRTARGQGSPGAARATGGRAGRLPGGGDDGLPDSYERLRGAVWRTHHADPAGQQPRTVLGQERRCRRDQPEALFIDSDCIPLGTGLAAHLKVLAAGCDVSFGEIRTPGTGFWDRLQRDANRWRLRSFHTGRPGPSPPRTWLFVRRCSTRSAESTPSSTATASRTGTCSQGLPTPSTKICLASEARVLHEDEVRLASVSKLLDAGFHSAHHFRNRHPQVYAAMRPEDRLDCETRPWLRLVDRLTLARGRGARPGPGPMARNGGCCPFAFRALVAHAVLRTPFPAWDCGAPCARLNQLPAPGSSRGH